VPTVSVLLGEQEVWEWAWSRWQRSQRLPCTLARGASREALLREWLCDARTLAAARAALFERAAPALGASSSELEARARAHSAAQQPAFSAQLERASGLDRELIQALLEDGAAVLRWLGADARALPRIAELLGPRLPALFWCRPEPEPESWLAEACSTLIALAEAVPRAELALALDEADFARWRARAKPREAALLGAGVLRLLASPGTAPANDASSVSYDAAEFARSRAELALYRRLERRQRTRGLFELNRMLDARFGSAPLEVDLACEQLRIAIEVDGYHHFRDAAAYRRDRSKDVLLQQLGYTVVRVLANDVMSEIEFVLSTIDLVVERRLEGSVA
jgi:very-short-patch-repair endonuclease